MYTDCRNGIYESLVMQVALQLYLPRTDCRSAIAEAWVSALPLERCAPFSGLGKSIHRIIKGKWK